MAAGGRTMKYREPLGMKESMRKRRNVTSS